MKRKINIGGTMTLGEMLGMSELIGDVEIINECNETLLIASYVDENVCNLANVLSEDLLERTVLNYGTRDNRTLFKVSGVEDAE